MADDPRNAPLRNRLDPWPIEDPAWYDMSAGANERRGPWLREYMPNSLADVLSGFMAYAPLAVPAMRGRVMQSGVRPQDFAISNRMPDAQAAPGMSVDLNPSIQSASRPMLHSAEARQSMGGMENGLRSMRDTLGTDSYTTAPTIETMAMVQKRINELKGQIANQEAWTEHNMRVIPESAGNRNFSPEMERAMMRSRNALDGYQSK